LRAETADYPAKARATLTDARQIGTLPLPHVGAREAYYAALHAAQAYIFERTGKVARIIPGVTDGARAARRSKAPVP
jgi:hypothetical protein